MVLLILKKAIKIIGVTICAGIKVKYNEKNNEIIMKSYCKFLILLKVLFVIYFNMNTK